MALKKINFSGKALFVFLLFSLLSLLSISHNEILAFCEEPEPTGDYTVTSSCSFAGTTDGVDNGNLTINGGVTLQIDQGQTIVWNSGKSVIINGIIALSGTLLQDNLWAVDADGDGCTPSLTWYRTSNKPANSVRVSTLASRIGSVDIDDNNSNVCAYSYSESSYYSQNAYYRYAQDAYYRYAQDAYYRYGQSAYYRYGQSAYYRYNQGSYYRYAQAYYSACFTSEMKVAMSDGTYKAIKDIKPGDVVVSFDVKTGKKGQDTVTKLLIHPNTPGGYLVINKTLEVTPNHMVWSPNKNAWVGIGTLKIGDSLLNSAGEKIKIATIDKVEGTYTVYNLSLSGPNNNFFTEGFLVHNHKVVL